MSKQSVGVSCEVGAVFGSDIPGAGCAGDAGSVCSYIASDRCAGDEGIRIGVAGAVIVSLLGVQLTLGVRESQVHRLLLGVWLTQGAL